MTKSRRFSFGFAAAAAAIFLGGASSALHAQTKSDCPAALPAATTCYTGASPEGGFYLVAIPENWNRVLVMHAHGGPETAAPTLKRSIEDVTRWSVVVKAGYAWVGSTFRRGGYGVTMAAEDTENLRKFFIKTFGQPKRTIMHGQSWGGNVGAKVIELYGVNPDGSKNYDGALLTSGVLAGGSRGYDYRMDLRAVYQYYCNNHPRPSEPQYPLWMGLPADGKMTRDDLQARVNECTGLQLPAEQRTEVQKRNLSNILAVTRIPQRTLAAHLSWATFLFSDIAHKRLQGRNPFSNDGVQYAGSDDDEALNKGVVRYQADRGAVAELARDSDPTGKVALPVLTIHGIDDPTAFVEMESAYRRTLDDAGTSANLVQVFTKEKEHSFLGAPQYPALLEALLGWIDNGVKPTPQSVATLCEKFISTHDGGCHIDIAYQPKPYESRVYPRNR